MAKWHQLEPAQLFPEPIQRAVAAVEDVVGTVTAATDLTARALRQVTRFAALTSTNPIETAVRSVVAELERVLSGITGESQVHAVLIPIRKKIERNTKAPSEVLSWLTIDEPAYAFVNKARQATGGSSVFFRTLCETLQDEGDLARPLYGEDYAVAGAVVLAGAETLSDLTVPFRLFTTLLTGNLRTSPAPAGVLPTVQNLRVTPMTLNSGTGLALNWSPVPPISTAPLFTDERIFAREIFLIKVSAPLTRGWYSWDDLFTEQPPADESALPASATAKVIARIRNHGFVVSHVAPDEGSVDCHFVACVRYSLDRDDTTTLHMGPLSNAVRMTRTRPAPSTRKAVPPDWIASPSLIALFPPLNDAVQYVRMAIAQLGAQTTVNSGGQQMLTSVVEQLTRQVAQWESTLAGLTDVTARLTALTALKPPGGLYATTITKSSGGTDAWMAELSRRLADTTDDSRPEFSDDAMVLGYVVLAGAPRLPDLQPLIALFELLFGKRDKTPLQRALDDLDAVNAPLPPTPAPPAPGAVRGYTDNLEPSTTPTC